MRQLYIDGEWVDTESSEGIEVDSPVDETVIDTVPAGSQQDVRKAVEAARRSQQELRDRRPTDISGRWVAGAVVVATTAGHRRRRPSPSAERDELRVALCPLSELVLEHWWRNRSFSTVENAP